MELTSVDLAALREEASEKWAASIRSHPLLNRLITQSKSTQDA